jgi:hypothetical protein
VKKGPNGGRMIMYVLFMRVFFPFFCSMFVLDLFDAKEKRARMNDGYYAGM